jgi:spore coat protein U-like protein
MVKIGTGLVVGLMAICPAPLAAGTASATMAVTATVEDSCRISARSITWEKVPTRAKPSDGQAPATIACTPCAPYLVTFTDMRNVVQAARQLERASFAPVGYTHWSVRLAAQEETITISVAF